MQKKKKIHKAKYQILKQKQDHSEWSFLLLRLQYSWAQAVTDAVLTAGSPCWWPRWPRQPQACILLHEI